MVFSSVTFLTVFLPITVILYYFPFIFLKNKSAVRWIKTYKNAILCISSLFFYAWGEPRNIILMLLSIVFNFTVALHMNKCKSSPKVRRILLVFSLCFNIGLLVFFKYSSFLVDNASAVFGVTINYSDPALPIGISFYTFQILSYVIDVYKGKVEVQHSPLDFALYISMFPQLIAGPIVQYSIVEKQLAERKESFENVTEGIFVFIKGLSKKTVLANTAGSVFELFISDGFENLSFLGAWTAVIFYAFQIYFDFGGYSDMAKGLGIMFGFTFPDNFNHPYEALSVTDFWRRWHITLSSWFRDYVYIPLGGNRCSKMRNIFNLFVVWSLTGLWHGASWNFLLWGIYYFCLLISEKYFFGKFIEKLPNILRRLITFIFVLFGWVLFSCTEISDIGFFFASMFGLNGALVSSDIYNLSSNFVVMIIMAVCSTSLFSFNDDNKGQSHKILRLTLSIIMFVLSVIYLIGDTYNPFLYFRF